ncbi:hypothetical protein T4D_12148 [Trichinella pseudospiralis]|uniref:Uncharacterized protein n=1 Tax=Trichinella pseudospiralis TaxID=6337 RepID=A0A0V1EZN5_TRIPS|nr:hypothetical protein T4D_14238 [Trichinella pseudospiralis]KRY80154.1 hypothetical protein T4D_12148 [Trichinella pseudospiralis]
MSEILKIFRIFENRQPEGLPQTLLNGLRYFLSCLSTAETYLSRCMGFYVTHLPFVLCACFYTNLALKPQMQELANR